MVWLMEWFALALRAALVCILRLWDWMFGSDPPPRPGEEGQG